MILKHFDIKEFDSPDEENSGLKMSPILLAYLDKARSIAKTPFIINSAYRTSTHNRDIGGSETSSHLGGYAVDIKCTTSYIRLIILSALIEAGFTRIGISPTFIHTDVDPIKLDCIWLY